MRSATPTPTSEPPPEAPPDPPEAAHQKTSTQSRQLVGGARIAAVLASYFAPSTLTLSEYESWLQERFRYWCRQLGKYMPNPESELLSELGAQRRLDVLVAPPKQAYANVVLHRAFLDVLRRERGRGEKRDHEHVEYQDDVMISSADGAAEPYQLRRAQVLETIEKVVDQMGPRQREALTLRAQGLSDEAAGEQSAWPCNAATFRRRIKDAQDHIRRKANEHKGNSQECEGAEKENP